MTGKDKLSALLLLFLLLLVGAVPTFTPRPTTAASGSPGWQEDFGGSVQAQVFGTTIGPDGSIYEAGAYMPSSGPADDALIMKYSSGGSLLWSEVWAPGEINNATGVAIDSSGSYIYVTGTTHPSTSNLGEIFVLKLSASNGSLCSTCAWIYPASSTVQDTANAIAVSPTESAVYVAGSTTYVNGNYCPAQSGGNSACIGPLVVKISTTNGQILWQRVWEQEVAGCPGFFNPGALTSVAVSPNGQDVYGGGWVNIYDPCAPGSTDTAGAVLGYTSSGTFLFANYDHNQGPGQMITSIGVSPDGSKIIVAGFGQNAVDITPPSFDLSLMDLLCAFNPGQCPSAGGPTTFYFFVASTLASGQNSSSSDWLVESGFEAYRVAATSLGIGSDGSIYVALTSDGDPSASSPGLGAGCYEGEYVPDQCFSYTYLLKLNSAGSQVAQNAWEAENSRGGNPVIATTRSSSDGTPVAISQAIDLVKGPFQATDYSPWGTVRTTASAYSFALAGTDVSASSSKGNTGTSVSSPPGYHTNWSLGPEWYDTDVATTLWGVPASVSFSVSGSGSTTPSGTHYYFAGATIGISASAGSGYVFSQWSSSNPSTTIASSTSLSTTALIGGAGTITADLTSTLKVSMYQSGSSLYWVITGLTPNGGFNVKENTSQGFSDKFSYTASSSGTDSRAFTYGGGTPGDKVTLTVTDTDTSRVASASYTVTGGGATLAIDGSQVSCGVKGTSCTTGTLTTSHANDVYLIYCFECTSAPANSKSLPVTAYTSANGYLEEYYFTWSSSGSITATCKGSTYTLCAMLAISGESTSQIFDPNGAVPCTGSTNTCSISTSNSNDIILGFCFSSYSTNNACASAGSGYTALGATTPGNSYTINCEYLLVSTTQTSKAVNWGGANGQAVIGEAIQA